MMRTTFHNVTVTVEGESARECYLALCRALAPMVAYSTDTYNTDEQVVDDGFWPDGETRSTTELL